MTLGETVLSKLAEWRWPADSGRHIFRHADAGSGWSISLVVEKAGTSFEFLASFPK